MPTFCNIGRLFSIIKFCAIACRKNVSQWIIWIVGVVWICNGRFEYRIFIPMVCCRFSHWWFITSWKDINYLWNITGFILYDMIFAGDNSIIMVDFIKDSCSFFKILVYDIFWIVTTTCSNSSAEMGPAFYTRAFLWSLNDPRNSIFAWVFKF